MFVNIPLENRSGIVYLSGSTKPYTGKIVELYDNGNKKKINCPIVCFFYKAYFQCLVDQISIMGLSSF